MLCRDHCHYCTFAKPPARLETPFLTPEEVVAIAEAGRAMGCKEALFTLGDRPEERYEVARAWLDERGYGSTLDYVRAVAIRVIEETGLLPHLNPGVMSYEEQARLRHVAASMGMMLETSSARLAERGGPHFGSPDKVPAVRLRTIEDAGRLAIPFTTGILVGIGETLRERAESLLAIRDLHRRYRHVQEVIVQNFRAKPGTAMHAAPEPDDEEFLAAVATARIVLGPRMHLQAPPNLSDPAQQARLLDAGIDDWGGVSPLTPDHVNPEKPWPTIEALAATTASRGKELRERLTIYPEYATRPDPYLAGKMRAPVAALMGPDGRAVAGQRPEPIPWQDPEVTWKPRTIDLTFAKGPDAGLRDDAGAVYGDFDALEVTKAWAVARRAARRGSTPRSRAALAKAATHRADHRRRGARALRGRRPRARCALPGRRRPARGGGRRRRHLRDQSEHQLLERLLRRVPVLRVRPARGRRRVLHAHADRGRRPRRGGVGPGRHRGLHAGRYPSRASGRLLLRPGRCGEGARCPTCTSTRSARWRSSTARRSSASATRSSSRRRRRAGSARSRGRRRRSSTTRCAGCSRRGSSRPTRGRRSSAPHTVWASGAAARSCSVTSTPRRTGWRTSGVSGASRRDTGGFTEFVPLPFVHQNAPIYLAGKARPGATFEENLRMHAVARILLDGLIANIQVSWVKLGVDTCQAILQAGANDFGGTLMEETISRMAGAEWGIEMTPDRFDEAILEIGRTPAVRTTTYGRVGVPTS